jgi:hypothetical protein
MIGANHSESLTGLSKNGYYGACYVEVYCKYIVDLFEEEEEEEEEEEIYSSRQADDMHLIIILLTDGCFLF